MTHRPLAALLALISCVPPAFAAPGDVRPFEPFPASRGMPDAASLAGKIHRLAAKSLRFNLGWADREQPPYNRPNGPAHKFKDASEGQIRPLSHVALGIALLHATHALPGDAAEQRRAIDAAVRMIRGAAGEHRASAPLPADVRWGDHWQSPLWCANYVEAAWVVWDRLDETTRAQVIAMATHEADRIAKRPVPYWTLADGTVKSPGDTKAEENAWDSRILDVCQAIMPDHPNAAAWRDRFTELAISAYARPSDLTSDRVIDGKPVSQWLGGYNAFESGLVENHKRLHPDYASAIDLLCESITLNSLARRPISRAIPFNFDVVYDGLNTFAFVPGQVIVDKPANPPGGTVYRVDAGGAYLPHVYFPHGNDWSAVRLDNFAQIDVFASVIGIDVGKPYDAHRWADVRYARALELQARHDGTPLEGTVYADAEFAKFRPREAHSFAQACEAWTALWLRANGRVSPWSGVPAR